MKRCEISQRDSVLKHLQEHGKISPLQALREYGCMRLAAVIHVLRQRGHPITTDTRRQGSSEYAVYRLEGFEKVASDA